MKVFKFPTTTELCGMDVKKTEHWAATGDSFFFFIIFAAICKAKKKWRQIWLTCLYKPRELGKQTLCLQSALEISFGKRRKCWCKPISLRAVFRILKGSTQHGHPSFSKGEYRIHSRMHSRAEWVVPVSFLFEFVCQCFVVLCYFLFCRCVHFAYNCHMGLARNLCSTFMCNYLLYYS